MRAVRILEKRFKLALANIEKETDIQTGVDENANLSKQITVLEANGVEKDEKINALNADLATLTKNAATSDKQVADTKAAQDDITKLLGPNFLRKELPACGYSPEELTVNHL